MKTSNKRLHYFNPGHETAIYSGMTHYTPAASVRKMAFDLTLLPLWYGQKNDYILIEGSVDPSIFLKTIPHILRPALFPVTSTSFQAGAFQEPVEASPWGLSPQSIHIFNKLQTVNNQLIIPPWKEEYIQLTARQTAAVYFKLVQVKNPAFRKLKLPYFCTDISEVQQYMANNSPPFVLKMPYSCSGRGLYWITNNHIDKLAAQWIHGVIRKQGVVSIEPALNKACDFAMEFESDGKGNIKYTGLSVFNTLKKGAFSGNLLGSQQILEKQLTQYILKEQLHEIQDTLISILSQQLGTVYKGHFGIDMLIYRDKDGSYAIHPFIEINLRYTMGLVAIQLSRKLIHPDVSGQFVVSYDKNAYISHLKMQKEYPLQIKAGKILSGYFPLCPVHPDTSYRAYILS
ncbi:MAG: hypothetical protein LBH90_08770 [Tannerella sp.]|jgi:hypothetical protein|nr:hypothetical protein [Tannerella sp.]